MKKTLKYSVTITSENVASNTPILLRGPLEEQIHMAQKLNYDAVELQLCDPEKVSFETILNSCEKTHLKISAIATGLEYSINKLSLVSDDARVRRRLMETLKQYIDLAEALHCLVIIGCIRGNIPTGSSTDLYWQRFDDSVQELAAYAANRSVNLVIEAINFYANNYLNSVSETVAYLKRINRSNVKLHIDTHHINIEDENFIEAVRQSEPYLAYVHFSGTNRLYPSPGRIPYGDIQDELRRMDYDGYIALECIPIPDACTAAMRGIKYLKTI